MDYKLKLILLAALLNTTSRIDVKCLEDKSIKNNHTTPYINNFDLSTFEKKGDNQGCTGEVEQRLINGEKFLTSENNNEKDEKLGNTENIKDFISLKTNQLKDYITHFFKSNSASSNDFYKILFDCAKASSAKPYLVDICVNKYLKKHNIEFSQTCLSCFSSFIGCTYISCNKECAKDQCTEDCKKCSQKHCFKSLLNCTKLDSLPDPCK
ncbi:hypothetical protein, conserved [Plasmodium gonderi]|uniref:Variable surface protein n=1 Tax=Plasmodium gonderi TaxID=77519 RepID=A0A1Y1J8P0_PLAGO|nr:hypothetical protein, conserved [Plasmodium gonderi]GAW78876.1 hypothetical protein, conserved [Plasmodium gonderi]